MKKSSYILFKNILSKSLDIRYRDNIFLKRSIKSLGLDKNEK